MKLNKAVALINSLFPLPKLLEFYKYNAHGLGLPVVYDNIDELISKVEFTAKDLAIAVAYGVEQEIINTEYHFYLGVDEFYTYVPRIVKGFNLSEAREWVLNRLSSVDDSKLMDELNAYKSKFSLDDEVLKKGFSKFLIENTEPVDLMELVNTLSNTDEYGFRAFVFDSLSELDRSIEIDNEDYTLALLNGDGKKCLDENSKYFVYWDYDDKPRVIRALTENEFKEFITEILLQVPNEDLVNHCKGLCITI